MPSPYTNGIMPSFGVIVPPGDALNTTDADIKGGLQPTFFADGCRFYVEAASVNGIISEILNAVNCMGLEYDPDRLDNLCLAIKAVLSPDNAPAIVAAICANAAAQASLASCLIEEIATAFCENTGNARATFAECLFTNTLNVPELVVSCILSDGEDNEGQAIDTLAAGLISGDEDNQLVQGSDGLLYVAASDGGGIDTPLLWTIRVGVGQVYLVDQSMPGAEIPPEIWNATGPVFVKLTSGDAYNSGSRLIEYTNTGNPALGSYVSTAKINVPGPLFGRVIHMLNSEQSMLRPREVNGALQLDAMQGHDHDAGSGNYYGLRDNAEGNRNFIGGGEPTGYSMAAIPLGAEGPPSTLAGYEAVRVAQETRVKNIGVTAYMRVR